MVVSCCEWSFTINQYSTVPSRTANGGTPVPHVLQSQMAELRDRCPALAEKYPKLPFET